MSAARLTGAIVLALSLLLVPGFASAQTAPDGSIAFVSNADGDYDIYTMNADGSNVVNLTDSWGSFEDLQPAWSPDGTRIAFVSDRSGTQDIWSMAADGNDPLQLTEEAEGGWAFGPTWAPDGSAIAFTSTRDGDWEIFEMAADGSGETNLTGPNQDLAYDDMNPDWSPDGSTIVFEGIRAGASEILSMNADGTGEVNLTAEDDPPYANYNAMPSYRPDGSKIAFATQPNDGSNEWDIVVMDPDGTNKEPVLPDDEWQDLNPTWSPDGNQIAFNSNRSEWGQDIFVMDYPPVAGQGRTLAATSDVTQLTADGGSHSPDWTGSETPAPATLVGVSSTGFDPTAITVAQGKLVRWHNLGPGNHGAADASGMGLFRSGLLAPGGTYDFRFTSAGKYLVRDPMGNAQGLVRVPTRASPASGGKRTTFTVTWGSIAPQPGFVADVQIRRPGGDWKMWRSNVTTTSSAFRPEAGGVYRFRSRLQRTSTGKASGWSPVGRITVG